MRALYRSPATESDVRRWCTERLREWPTQHTTKTVPTVLGGTHLTTAGGGPDLCIYLPGTNFNAATSLGLLTQLAARCQVTCVDLPGQPGLSSAERPRDDSSSGAWLESIIGQCPGSGTARSVVLMGHSRGAALALSAPPASVDRLVLVSPAGIAAVRITLTLLARSTSWVTRPDERRSTRLVELMSGPEPVPSSDSVVEWMTLIARSTRTTGAPGPQPPDVLDRWRARDVRVLVGEHDTFFPPERLEDRVRSHLGVALEVVHGAGHLLVDQRPDVLVGAVLEPRAG